MTADYITTAFICLLLCYPAIALLLYLNLCNKQQERQIAQWQRMYNESEQYGKTASEAFQKEAAAHYTTAMALYAALGYSKEYVNPKRPLQ